VNNYLKFISYLAVKQTNRLDMQLCKDVRFFSSIRFTRRWLRVFSPQPDTSLHC